MVPGDAWYDLVIFAVRISWYLSKIGLLHVCAYVSVCVFKVNKNRYMAEFTDSDSIICYLQ